MWTRSQMSITWIWLWNKCRGPRGADFYIAGPGTRVASVRVWVVTSGHPGPDVARVATPDWHESRQSEHSAPGDISHSVWNLCLLAEGSLIMNHDNDQLGYHQNSETWLICKLGEKRTVIIDFEIIETRPNITSTWICRQSVTSWYYYLW